MCLPTRRRRITYSAGKSSHWEFFAGPVSDPNCQIILSYPRCLTELCDVLLIDVGEWWSEEMSQ
jgi:hypothetical protein